jgi:hypothetical protein
MTRWYFRWLTKEEHDAEVAAADALPKTDGYARQTITRRDLDAANTRTPSRPEDLVNAPESERERGLPN